MPSKPQPKPGPNTFFFTDYRSHWGLGYRSDCNQIEYTAHLTFDKDPEGKDFITIDAITCDAGFDLDDLLDDQEISNRTHSSIFDYAASLFIPEDPD
jgi:hypothetical protein